MALMDIAIDLGTSYITVYALDGGIVLHEPSLVAFIGGEESRNIKAIGTRAAEMMGRTPGRTTLVCPFNEGYITEPNVCAMLLKECIKRLMPASFIFMPKVRALITVPTGLTVSERKIYEDVCTLAGIHEVRMVDNIMATAVGFDLPVNEPAGGMLVNIGGGSTEVALISLSGIIAGCSVNVGGNMMDKAMLDYISGKYGLKCGLNSVRKLKHSIASLYPNDISSAEIKGVDKASLTPAAITVDAADLYETLSPYYTRITEAISGIINLCPPELAGDILKMGIYIAGGGAKIPGLKQFFENALGIRVTVKDNAEFIAITGAGKLLSDSVLLKEIQNA